MISDNRDGNKRFYGLRRFNRRTTEVGLSVVIIGRNESVHLAKCIESAIHSGKLSGLLFEIIYVDSASTDDSVRIACQYPISVIRIEPGEWRCAAAGRCLGTRFARGNYVAFLDGDMVCAPNWFKKALQYFYEDQGNVGAISGNRLDIDPNSPAKQARCIRHCYSDIVEIQKLSGASIISRDALDASGGFDPHLISFEERELAGRIRNAGFKILGIPHDMVEHHGFAYGVRETKRRQKSGYYIGLGQYVRRLWSLRKLRSTVLAIKVQVLFCAWLFGMAGALVAAVVWKTPWPTVVAIGSIPFVTAIVSVRLKNFYRGVIFILVQPFIIKGLMQGILRRPSNDRYDPKISTIQAGHLFI